MRGCVACPWCGTFVRYLNFWLPTACARVEPKSFVPSLEPPSATAKTIQTRDRRHSLGPKPYLAKIHVRLCRPRALPTSSKSSVSLVAQTLRRNKASASLTRSKHPRSTSPHSPRHCLRILHSRNLGGYSFLFLADTKSPGTTLFPKFDQAKLEKQRQPLSPTSPPSFVPIFPSRPCCLRFIEVGAHTSHRVRCTLRLQTARVHLAPPPPRLLTRTTSSTSKTESRCPIHTFHLDKMAASQGNRTMESRTGRSNQSESAPSESTQIMQASDECDGPR